MHPKSKNITSHYPMENTGYQTTKKKKSYKWYHDIPIIPKLAMIWLHTLYAGCLSQPESMTLLFLDPLRMSTRWLTVKFFSKNLVFIANPLTIWTISMAKLVMSLISCCPFLQLSQGAPEDLHFRGSKTSPRYCK